MLMAVMIYQRLNISEWVINRLHAEAKQDDDDEWINKGVENIVFMEKKN